MSGLIEPLLDLEAPTEDLFCQHTDTREPLLDLEDPGLSLNVGIILTRYISLFTNRWGTRQYPSSCKALTEIVAEAVEELLHLFHFRPLFESPPSWRNAMVCTSHNISSPYLQVPSLQYRSTLYFGYHLFGLMEIILDDAQADCTPQIVCIPT
jgi:hypothetical protein